MRFNSSRKTWITAGAILALLSFGLGLVFHFKLLDLSVSVFVVVGILFLASLFLVIVSIRAWNSGSRLKKWLSRIYLGTVGICFMLLSTALFLLYDKTLILQTNYDFYFCSSEDLDKRINKFEGLLKRQFQVIDEFNPPEKEYFKAEVLTSLAHTYANTPSKDRKNNLKLARWFLTKAKSHYKEKLGIDSFELLENQIIPKDEELQGDPNPSEILNNHDVWAPPGFDKSKLMDKENKQN